MILHVSCSEMKSHRQPSLQPPPSLQPVPPQPTITNSLRNPHSYSALAAHSSAFQRTRLERFTPPRGTGALRRGAMLLGLQDWLGVCNYEQLLVLYTSSPCTSFFLLYLLHTKIPQPLNSYSHSHPVASLSSPPTNSFGRIAGYWMRYLD